MSNGNSSPRVTIRDVYDQVEKLEEKIEKGYVHKSEFAPIKQIVYGLVGIVLVTVAKIILESNINVLAWFN